MKILIFGMLVLIGQISAQENVPLSPTNISSSAAAVISYRFQRHFWVTADGVQHVLINAGTSRNALRLYSSADGRSWKLERRLAGTSSRSRADGTLEENRLTIAYTGAHGEVRVVELDWKQKWRVVRNRMIASARKIRYDRPTVARDAGGTLWVCAATFHANLHGLELFVAEGKKWRSAGAPIPANDSSQRSGCLIRTPVGLALVYTDHPEPHTGFYQLRVKVRNAADPAESWSAPTMVWQFTNNETDSYGAHFSAVCDDTNTLHVVTRSNRQLVYARVSAATGELADTAILMQHIVTPYQQISLGAGGRIVIATATTGLVRRDIYVFSSEDGGDSFANTHIGTLNPEEFVSPARLEIPESFSDWLPLLRQFTPDGTTQGLAAGDLAFGPF